MAIILLRRLAAAASTSRTLAPSPFLVDFPPLEPGERYFDLTTPMLVSTGVRRLGPGRRLLDMGTGAFATIGLALWRRTGCDVVSTDVTPELVRRARANVEANGAPIRVVQARFFEGLEGGFDLVTFNPPYVPSAMLSGPDVQSDGGPEGTTVIEGFLDALAERGGQATALLGVNRLLVSRERVARLLEQRPGLGLTERLGHWSWPVDVYVLRRRS